MTAAPRRKLARRTALLALLVCALAPASASAVPSATGVSVSPQRPNVNQAVTFSVGAIDWDGAEGTVQWDFGDGSAFGTGTSVNHAYAAPGSKPARLILTDGEMPPAQEQTIIPLSVSVNSPPNASFVFNPVAPSAGQDVLFASTSTDPDGDGLSFRWDFAGVGPFDEPSRAFPFSTAGSKTVTLTVTDSLGASSSTTRQVLVSPARGDLPPTAGFAFSPRKPRVGDQVEFVSSAQDPEGELRERRWDLDGDGQFDDARGDEVLHTFASAGTHTVRFRAEDAAGNAAVRERSVAVARSGRPRAGFLNPFPVVRITGEVRSRGARIRLLTVRAPRGAQIRLRCRGKACPAKRLRRVVKKERVRFKAFERMLWAGTRLEIFIRKPGTIGKYTRFAIRGGASPLRTDRCLVPGQKKPIRCPG